MKYTKFGIVLVLILSMLFAGVACNGTSDGVDVSKGSQKIDFYSGDEYDEEGNIRFNSELFYINEDKGPGPDPFVFDDTERSGYYYIWSTLGQLFLYRSKDMMNMEAVGPALELISGTDENYAVNNAIWAPELVYDENDGYYYLFFSATPAGNDGQNTGLGVINADSACWISYLARSEDPEGPYQLIDFTSSEAKTGGWAHTYNTTPGTLMTNDDIGMWGLDASGNATQKTASNTVYRIAYTQSYAKFAYFDPELYTNVTFSDGRMDALWSRGGYSTGIDLHPFVDKDGQKYLYWTFNLGDNIIYCVKMAGENGGSWLTPDWSTATAVMAARYWTIEDWREGDMMNDESEYCYDYNTAINEGTAVIEHNGKYYLTFSFGYYEDNTYQVAQAVGDSPMGPFEKLPEEQNGILLSAALEGSEEVSGTGHHCILTIGDQLFIYYHTHNSYVAMGAARHGNLDEMKWVTIDDGNGGTMDVLVVNGATTSPQPKIEKHATYKNVAEEATITLEDESALAEGSSLSWANDGLLSVCKNGSYEFYDVYVQETQITKTATFKIELESPTAVRAVMVYNSKMESYTFLNIRYMEFIDSEGNSYYLENVAFPEGFIEQSEVTGIVQYVSPGAAAFAEFYELANITTVRVTVEVPAGQDIVGISEIRVLGK